MHEVEALIAKTKALAEGTCQFDKAVVCPLAQSFSLLPITDAFMEELAHYASKQSSITPPIEHMPEGLHPLAIDISLTSPVAYIRTAYFGGQGRQDAAAWDRGDLKFSPRTPGYWQPWPNTSISQALRAIGVVADAGLDEFDTLGLGKHRATDRWANSIR